MLLKNVGLIGPGGIVKSTLRHTSLLALAAFVGVSATVTAQADDFVINTPVVVTNGGNVVDGNDSITVTNSGSITVADYGINATGMNNTIANAGTISTTGNLNMGINGDYDSTITNTGSISTTGNGANGIYGEYNNTITNTGSISTTGAGAEGIYGYGNNTITNTGSISTTGNGGDGISGYYENTITNTGSISTTGNGADGIYGYDNNTITNTGSISTTGNGAYGIYADEGNAITNSGSISTTGNNAAGISTRDNNIITNSGSISTTGDNAAGIFAAGDDNTISISGSISTTGSGAAGIYAFSDSTITISGSISTTGSSAPGILASSGNTITNSGTISTTGSDAEGIFANSNNTITNSGKVVAAQGSIFGLAQAFRFNGANNTLNLQAPAFVGGVFNLGDNTTLNINTGPSHSILWTFDPTELNGGAPNISGSVPVFLRMVSATELQVATFDPTSLAASFDLLAGTTGLLSDLMARRLSGGGGVAGSSNSFVFSDQSANLNKVDPVAGHFGAGQGRAWLSAFGSQFDYDSTSTALDSDLDSWGVAGGYDWMMSDDLKLGLLAGYMNSNLKAKSKFATSYDNDTSNFFAGLYGRKGFGAGFLNFAVTTGFSKTDQKRFVNNNLAPLGVSHAKSDYKGYWVSPELTLGTQFDVAHGWQAIPSLKLRYASQWLKGYSESGSASNAKVGSRHVAIGEASVDLAVQRKIDIATATLNIGYLYRASLGDKKTSITMIGQSQSVKNSAKDRRAVYFGAAVNMNVYNNLNLDLSARGDFGKNYSGYAATATLSASF